MSAVAFPEVPPERVPDLVPEFLATYRVELSRHGAPFPGVEALLSALGAGGVRWGMLPLNPFDLACVRLPVLGCAQRCAVLVGGDSLGERTPHPRPLRHAAAALRLAPGGCAYVDDDSRAIDAARAAGRASVVALWGYRP